MVTASSLEPLIPRLLSRLERVEGEKELGQLLLRLISPKRAVVVSFLNAHAVNLAANDVAFADALHASDYLLRDGSGVKIACHLFHIAPGANLNGTDLIPELLARFKGRRILVIGAEPQWFARAMEVLKMRGLDAGELTGLDGFRPEQDYLELVRDKRPELVVLGLGMPRQERLALKIREVMSSAHAPCTIVSGGAIIDFIAGKFPRAPFWIRKTGFEWAYRLGQEPSRLAKRYVLGNPLFMMRLLWARLNAAPYASDTQQETSDQAPSE
jgi:exopolysaccharide biosynthesis WecB/TagA/CpsF family protein